MRQINRLGRKNAFGTVRHATLILLAFLIPLKLKNPLLYRQFILGERRASDLLDYVEAFDTPLTDDRGLDEWLIATEFCLYYAEVPDPPVTPEKSSAIVQLELLVQDEN